MECMTCEKCGNSFDFTGIRGHTDFIYCDKCNHCLEGSSDYGQGPVLPASIWKGNKRVAYIKGVRTILDSENNKIAIKIPHELAKDSYSNIFAICEYVYEQLSGTPVEHNTYGRRC